MVAERVVKGYKLRYEGTEPAVFKGKPGEPPFFGKTTGEFVGRTIEIGYRGIELDEGQPVEKRRKKILGIL